MVTIRQIERLFNESRFRRLYGDLIACRAEALAGLEAELASANGIAALGVIRLDELTQSHTPLSRRFLDVVLTAQQKDGGWGEPAITALCLRALMTSGGQGPAIQRGLQYLANLQQTQGIWPREPLRRMPSDSLVSAFIMLELGDRVEFRETVRFDDAVDWFAINAAAMDPTAKALWSHAAMRCRLTLRDSRLATLWAA